MKTSICTIAGAVGSTVAMAFGGWDSSIITLLIFMGIDYITGLIVAGVFHKSKKTESGTLKSNETFKGLMKKCMILLLVIIGVRLDILINTNYIRDAICISFIVNEAISITENAGLMGVPIPKVIQKALDVLNKKGDENNE